MALSICAMGFMAYIFMVQGNVTASKDGRTAIVLYPDERDFVLEEMRGFLEAVQTITEALAAKDMETIATAAHQVGMTTAKAVPTPLMGKLPLEFKKLGFVTHEAFDDLSLDAKDMGDPEAVLTKLGQLLLNCTGCHAAYRLEAQAAN